MYARHGRGVLNNFSIPHSGYRIAGEAATADRRKPMYEFGEYRVGSRDRTLYRGGEIVPLPPKAVDVLIELLRSAVFAALLPQI
jgi:hypothetical protein